MANKTYWLLFHRSRSKAMLETVPIYSQSSFLSRTWAIVVLTAAALGAAVTVWMFFYVLQKIADGTLQGENQSDQFLYKFY